MRTFVQSEFFTSGFGGGLTPQAPPSGNYAYGYEIHVYQPVDVEFAVFEQCGGQHVTRVQSSDTIS